MKIKPCKIIPEFDHLKFLSKVLIDQTSGCWNWIGYIHPKGYGQHSIGSSNNFKAHRLSYEIFVGILDENNVIDHKCRNRKCCNPDHLREVSWRENTLENSYGEAAKNLKKERCNRGHEYTGEMKPHRGGLKRWCRICNNIRVREYAARKKANRK